MNGGAGTSGERAVLVDVDVQRDFCAEDGALRVPGSPNERFATLVGAAVERGVPILGSVDSHAWDAWEFASNDRVGPHGEDPKFPDHCVKGTPGWLKMPGTLPPRFRFVPHAHADDAVGGALAAELAEGRTQAAYFEKEVYSLFENPAAETVVRLVERAHGGTERCRFYVFGVATDYCVRAAALGLVERGFRATLLTDAVAGITEAGVEAAMREMAAAGVSMETTGALLARWS